MFVSRICESFSDGLLAASNAIVLRYRLWLGVSHGDSMYTMFPSPLVLPYIFRIEPVDGFGIPDGGMMPVANPPIGINTVPELWALVKQAVMRGGDARIAATRTASWVSPSIVCTMT